jgi:hypothetical protein
MTTLLSIRWSFMAAAAASLAFVAMPGCELLVDFDRSKIPEEGGLVDGTTEDSPGQETGPTPDGGSDTGTDTSTTTDTGADVSETSVVDSPVLDEGPPDEGTHDSAPETGPADSGGDATSADSGTD